MRRSVKWVVPVGAWVMVVLVTAGVRGQTAQGKSAPQTKAAQGHAAEPHDHEKGWTIPAGAENEKNPFPVNDALLAAGRKVFSSKCQRCHGPKALGNGPDADKAHKADMNLTVPERAAKNPDGVVFYKVWNGRTGPKMPKFGEELSKEQVWAVVAYVQSLRAQQ